MDEQTERDIIQQGENRSLYGSYDQLALRSAFASQLVEKPIEIEMLKLTAETRTDTIPVFDNETGEVKKVFTNFKNLLSHDTFFGKIENDIEFVMHDLNAHSSEVIKYLSVRKVRHWNQKTDRVEWINQGLNLQEFQYYTVHYKDIHLGLTRSRNGWFGELMQTNIAHVKSNLAPLLDKNREQLGQKKGGIRNWFAKIGGVAQ